MASVYHLVKTVFNLKIAFNSDMAEYMGDWAFAFVITIEGNAICN